MHGTDRVCGCGGCSYCGGGIDQTKVASNGIESFVDDTKEHILGSIENRHRDKIVVKTGPTSDTSRTKDG